MLEGLIDETIRMKSETQNKKSMPLSLNVLKYLTSKAKPDK